MPARPAIHIRLHRPIILLVMIALGLSSLIVVPSAQAQATVCAQTYTVKAGDNLFRIALASGTNYQALAAMNGISNPALIFVGQVLCLPGPMTGSTNPSSTVVAPTAGPSPTPLPSDPCFTRQSRKVQVTSWVYFGPDPGQRTKVQIRKGSWWLVCTNTTRTDWIPMVIGQQYPLWVPAGVFG